MCMVNSWPISGQVKCMYILTSTRNLNSCMHWSGINGRGARTPGFLSHQSFMIDWGAVYRCGTETGTLFYATVSAIFFQLIWSAVPPFCPCGFAFLFKKINFWVFWRLLLFIQLPPSESEVTDINELNTVVWYRLSWALTFAFAFIRQESWVWPWHRTHIDNCTFTCIDGAFTFSWKLVDSGCLPSDYDVLFGSDTYSRGGYSLDLLYKRNNLKSLFSESKLKEKKYFVCFPSSDKGNPISMWQKNWDIWHVCNYILII